MGVADSNQVEVLLVRHGQTWFNSLGRVQGWCDSPLTRAGRRTAAVVGRHFAEAGIGFDAAFAADMVRHRETARGILQSMGCDLEVCFDPDLREMSFGGFEGEANLTMWPILRDAATPPGAAEPDYAHILDQVKLCNPDPQFFAETMAEVAERAMVALRRITGAVAAEAAGDARVLVVSSGVTIACLISACGAPMPQGIHNGGVSRIVRDGEVWSVLSVDDQTWARDDAEPDA